MKTLFLFSLAFLMLGCAHKQILRKDVSPDELAEDDAQCKVQAAQITQADYAYRGTFMEGAMIENKRNEVYGLCLRGKGYK